MSLPPFTGHSAGSALLGSPADIQTDIGNSRTASSHGNGRLKRWLSLKKINVAYRQSASDNGAGTPAQPSKLRRSARAPPRSQQQSKSLKGCQGDSKRQLASDPEPSSTPMPVDLPKLKVAESSMGNRSVLPLLPLLHHHFSSPDLHCLREPQPIVEKSEAGRKETAAFVDCIDLFELGEQADSKHESRPVPPRRKRSLIYAMYCTAKSDDLVAPAPAQSEEAAVPQESDTTSALYAPPSQQQLVPSWLCSLYSLDTTEDISGTFVSCKSAPSASNSPMASIAAVPETTQSTAKQPTAQQRNKTSVEVMLLDKLSQQAPALRSQKRVSVAVSVAGSASMMSFVSSNRSSCAEQSLAENNAYRCSSKFAPRLSTVERSHDGRLLLRPSDSQISSSVTRDFAETACEAACDPDSGNVSLKGDSPHQEVLILAAKPATGTDVTESPSHRYPKDLAVEAFLPVLLMSPHHEPRSSAAHSPSDSLIFHASRLNASAVATSTSSSLACEQPSLASHAAQSEPSTASNLPVPRPPVRPVVERQRTSVATPPGPLTRPTFVTADPFTDVVDTARAGSIEAARLPTETCANSTDGMAEAKAQEQGAGAFTESEGSLSNTINASKDNDGTKLQGFDDGKSQWTNPAPLPALPEQVSTMEHTELLLHLPAARPLTSVSPNSPCSRFYTRSEESIGYCRPCGVNRDSRVLSIFSDLSDCDVLPLELAHVPQTQDVQLYNLHLSMLFDGQYGDNADLGTGLRLTTAGADIQSCSDTSSSGDNAYDDDVALADIAAVSGAIISPAPLQPRPSPVYLDATASAADCGSPRSTVLASSGSADGHGSSFSARTRKLTAALVRGAPLEGLRSLHRKIKPANQRASGDSVSSSNSDKESATKQQFNSDLRQRKAFRFNELVAVYETWDCDEYDRKGVPSVRLDASLIEEIKQELNEFKVYEMLVHNESRSNTHFIY